MRRYLFLILMKLYCCGVSAQVQHIADSTLSIDVRMSFEKRNNVLHLTIRNISSDTLVCPGTRYHQKKYCRTIFAQYKEVTTDSCFDLLDTTFHPNDFKEFPWRAINPCIILLPGQIYKVSFAVDKYSYSRCLYYRHHRYAAAGRSADHTMRDIFSVDSPPLSIDLDERSYTKNFR